MSGPDLYLTIDQGGHASRAILFDGEGKLVTEAFAGVETEYPAADRVEHDPEKLLSSVREALNEVAARLEGQCHRIKAAGLATQRSTIACWDRISGEPLSPAISWQDRRAAAWLKQFDPHCEEIHTRTGLRLSPHYGVSKLRWCLDHLPEVQSAADNGRLAWGPLAGFLLFRLAEERPLAIDPANASRTLLWDCRTLAWSPELLELFTLPAAPLPPSLPSRHPFGHLRLGDHRIPLQIVTGDQSAALFAYGEPARETTYINMGTGAFIQRPQGSELPDPGPLLASVVFQEADTPEYVLEGTVNGAGSALEWAQRELKLDGRRFRLRLAEGLAEQTEPPLFLNGVSGLGSPYWVADFSSRFVGEENIRGKLAAVAESILFLLAVNMEAMDEITSARSRQILISGGLATRNELCQRLADLAGCPVFRPRLREATARGLAYLLAGRPEGWPSTEGQWFRPAQHPALIERYRRWQQEMASALGHCAGTVRN